MCCKYCVMMLRVKFRCKDHLQVPSTPQKNISTTGGVTGSTVALTIWTWHAQIYLWHLYGWYYNYNAWISFAWVLSSYHLLAYYICNDFTLVWSITPRFMVISQLSKTPQATLNMHSSLILLTFIGPLQPRGTQQCLACSQQTDKHTLYSLCSHVSSTRSQTNPSDPIHTGRLALLFGKQCWLLGTTSKQTLSL